MQKRPLWGYALRSKLLYSDCVIVFPSPTLAKDNDGAMHGVDEISKIQRAHFSEGCSLKEISQDLAVSRATIRRVLRFGELLFSYQRNTHPQSRANAA